jgi:hypothetical protein
VGDWHGKSSMLGYGSGVGVSCVATRGQVLLANSLTFRWRGGRGGGGPPGHHLAHFWLRGLLGDVCPSLVGGAHAVPLALIQMAETLGEISFLTD